MNRFVSVQTVWDQYQFGQEYPYDALKHLQKTKVKSFEIDYCRSVQIIKLCNYLYKTSTTHATHISQTFRQERVHDKICYKKIRNYCHVRDKSTCLSQKTTSRRMENDARALFQKKARRRKENKRLRNCYKEREGEKETTTDWEVNE